MSWPPQPGAVLSQRALNRALLARQLLDRRSHLATGDALEHLVGLQAQSPLAPYVGLWTRLAGFVPETLAGMLLKRQAVRVALMRSTIHLVSSADCLWLRPLVDAVLERSLQASFAKGLVGVDLDDLARAGRELVEERPRTFAELGAELALRWPGRDPLGLAIAVRCRVALVQVPPRGIWGVGGLARHTSAEHWLGRPLQPAALVPRVEDLLKRYLRAFGPASVRDAQTWSGLSALRPVFERLRPQLVAFRSERGQELFDLPGAPLPDPEANLAPRFLPEYDNALLSHHDPCRIIGPGLGPRVFTRGALLVDGYVAGAWKIQRKGKRGSLTVEVFRPFSAAERESVLAEGTRLLAFCLPETAAKEVRLDP